MPKRTDISSILIIGAGPIVIGQACEFDYSGTQACKALRDEGYRVILVNSNPATIMTDPALADATYIEPITPATVARIIEKEKPDALLPTMGGQTALNTALDLAKSGFLERHGVELIGAKQDAIAKAEDRELFRAAMNSCGLATPEGRLVRTVDEGLAALDIVGLPAILRPSFTLGGRGGGIAYNRQDFVDILRFGLSASPVGEVLVEQSVLGWKEFEMEVVRDRKDNCIIVCSIENIDPMGVHTGDSITVAPALTLTDKEYQIMRDASIRCLREIGVETGGSNVQFAVNPVNGKMVVIEMNPRVSRSSALASKATGFPIAKIAAKLAVGYTLDELTNDITGSTPASFEPTIDYVVVKIPRFAFEKFKGAESTLTTSMKSVGEAMAIGRSFEEAMQKALRSLETSISGFDEIAIPGASGDIVDRGSLIAALSRPTSERILYVAEALRSGMSVDEVHQFSRIDPWFLSRIDVILQAEKRIRKDGLPQDALSWFDVKRLGFSDQRLAKLSGTKLSEVTRRRHAAGVHPVYKRIDTCAAEFASATPYLYSAYEHDFAHDGKAVRGECEAEPTAKQKIIILGGGPNRIGQGIEFDYCCVHAVYALQEAGFETIMVNCNPETVSTDYDTADRLYFEPLTAEDVVELIRVEATKGAVVGAIVQFGGQTPLKLAHALETAGIRILGTSVDAIDLAEDRQRFQQLVQDLNLKQPDSGTVTEAEAAVAIAERIGYPVMVRPSYVLGGRAMEIVHDRHQLLTYMREAVRVSGDNPVLVDRYLIDAIEVDVDALADGDDVFVGGIMEHIEEAGIHSGDSACALPPYSLSPQIIAEIERQTVALAKALKVVGLMNVQYAVKDGTVYILEVNPRASRTVPFVAKATGRPLAKWAARIMAGETLKKLGIGAKKYLHSVNHVAVKEAVFPFARFPGVDVVLGPEMRSTGEVMGIDQDFATAFAKAQLGAGIDLPREGTVFISVKDSDKPAMVKAGKHLADLGFRLIASKGTANYLRGHGLEVEQVNKVLEGQPHIVDLMVDGKIQLVFNTTDGAQTVRDSASMRQTALLRSIPYYTTLSGALAAVQAIASLARAPLDVTPIQAYFQQNY